MQTAMRSKFTKPMQWLMLLLVLLACTTPVSAQESADGQGQKNRKSSLIDPNAKNFNYTRCGVTVIPVMLRNQLRGSRISNPSRRLSYDSSTGQVVRRQSASRESGFEVTVDDKFDLNPVEGGVLLDRNSLGAIPDFYLGREASDIYVELLKQNIAKKVMDYLFCFDGRTISTDLLEQRALYNATDGDVLKEDGVQVKNLYTRWDSVLQHNYVIVVGIREKSVDHQSLKPYKVKPVAYVYKVDFSQQLLDILELCWLDENSTAQQIDAYKKLIPGLTYVKSIKCKECSGVTAEDAVHKCIDEVLFKLGYSVEAYKVVTPIYSLNPISAKIGKKEGLKNSDRYGVYEYVTDKNGNARYKRRGRVRATRVNDNREMASGDMGLSSFYQLSGGKIEEGMMLKQELDLKSSLAFSVACNGLWPINVEYDRLLRTSPYFGIMHYFGLGVGYYKGFDVDLKGDPGQEAGWWSPSLRYSLGMHPIQSIEVRASVSLGYEFYLNPRNEKTSDDYKGTAIVSGLGLQVGWQIFYPLQLFVKADYLHLGAQEEDYRLSQFHRFDKVNIGAGARVSF